MKKNRFCWFFVIMLIIANFISCVQKDKYEPLKKELQVYIDSITKNDSTVKNIAILVETPDFKWKGASGMAVPEENIKMLPDDQFVSASCVKMMMSTMVMLLMEQEMLKLEDKINTYLTDSIMNGLHVINGKSYGDQITIHQLLNHTSGLPDAWDNKFIEMWMKEPDKFWTPQEKTAWCKKNYTAKFEPGKSWGYSDIGYDLLGLIIEKVTGKKLYEAYNELLLKPLKMEHTYRPFYEIQRPAGRKPSNAYLENTCFTNWTAFSADWGGGGMMTNAEDLNTFIKAFENNRIFKKPETKDKMFDLVKVDEGAYYGFGIILYKLNTLGIGYEDFTDVYGHSGATGTFMFYSKSGKISITGTTNQLDEHKTADIYQSVLKMVKNM
ncbi:serine hydrolase domain-containing protein [Bacteroidota bacterium]